MDFDDVLFSFPKSASASSLPPAQSSISLPHQGSLCRLDSHDGTEYVLEILLEDKSKHELCFSRRDFEFTLQLFAIMDIDSKGHISKETVKEFVTIRCPVFWKRDEYLKLTESNGESPTFEELWRSVIMCSLNPTFEVFDDLSSIELGVEGWVVFCRFIALAQYLEAKRRFSGRHLQQTLKHRNTTQGSEMIVVDVPPPAAPISLSANQLAEYERENHTCLPLPELDLDHSLLAAHDVLQRRKDRNHSISSVKLELFGRPPLGLSSHGSNHDIEFCLTHYRDDMSDFVSVRRSMKDMKWLNDTLVSQKVLGGTLCGRILPPFPKHNSSYGDDSTMSSTSDALTAAATAGVGMIKSGIKSFWGSYTTTTPKLQSASRQERPIQTMSIPESYYNPNSPDSTSRQLQRYLNYLLDHPALSTSFPLNTILKASQSGLEAAKKSLQEHSRVSSEITENIPKLGFGNSSGSNQPNLSWVRTAAQAAVAVQLHGVLETSGLPAASARLQHASLPSFGHSRKSTWNEDEGEQTDQLESTGNPVQGQDQSFEEGVIQVGDELESDSAAEDQSGYDLLPLPVPTPERTVFAASDKEDITNDDEVPKEARFRYGGPLEEKLGDKADGQPVYIGEMAVDENIDKLREVIGSLDNTLSRSLASSGGIGKARKKRLELQLDVLRGLDSWEGLRGKFIAQRALLKGVASVEQSREVFDESDLMLIDDLSWQTSLASSAVSAAEDVRSTVRAARTATSAKVAASTAASDAQKALEGKFASVDAARAAQTRASIAQSHAIQATVVEHEAKTAKRRATLALAHDVKCWNAHRKREVLKTCLAYAKSQHEATRRSVDAWSCFRDGFVGPSVFPSTQTKRLVYKPKPSFVEEEPKTTIYGQELNQGQVIVAVEHDLFQNVMGGQEISPTSFASEPDTLLPLAVASPIPEEGEGDNEEDDDINMGAFDFGASATSLPVATGGGSQISVPTSPASTSPSATQSYSQSASSLPSKSREEAEVLTASMQSLVDGLMNWGGQIEEEDFALPTGMAASIMLEESNSNF
ncbi:unnamed protein product [Cylindrotheca closterium]|uniref:Uncharacterized protein n=1 Tax=Cylindrotheca closterium TaxID=2856 RepID=A0AAD2G332_9STRA|nr:unnamed protein product [Cylindrotheca closterium]